MILKYFRQKSSEKLEFFTQNKATICKNVIITWFFEKNAHFFSRKLPKISENCDHNIDPRSDEFSLIGRVFAYFATSKLPTVKMSIK
jgi:hypothetical protein